MESTISLSTDTTPTPISSTSTSTSDMQILKPSDENNSDKPMITTIIEMNSSTLLLPATLATPGVLVSDANMDDDNDQQQQQQQQKVDEKNKTTKKGKNLFSRKNVKKSDEYTTLQRVGITMTASLCGALAAIAATLFTPVIPIVIDELQATESEVLSTMSAFLIAGGIMPLIWGPLSDFFGRKIILTIAVTIFTAFNLAAGFSWNVYALLAFRILSAVGASAGMVVGTGVIADSHPPHMRGRALSYFMVGPFAGPIVGPLLGGVLGQAFGWQSTFYFGAALGALALLCVLLVLPETLAPSTDGKKRYPKPWKSLTFLSKPKLLAAMLPMTIIFGCYYAFVITFTFVMQTLFEVTVQEVGFFLVVLGVGTLLGTLLGGPLADKIAKGRSVYHRLLILVFAQFCFAIFLFAIGWTYTVNKIYPIVFSFFLGFLLTIPTAGVTSYLVEEASKSGKQAASSVSGLLFALMYLLAGVTSQITLLGETSLSIPWFFTMWGFITLVGFTSVTLVMIIELMKYYKAKKQSSSTSKSADLESQPQTQQKEEEPAAPSHRIEDKQPAPQQLELEAHEERVEKGNHEIITV